MRATEGQIVYSMLNAALLYNKKIAYTAHYINVTVRYNHHTSCTIQDTQLRSSCVTHRHTDRAYKLQYWVRVHPIVFTVYGVDGTDYHVQTA